MITLSATKPNWNKQLSNILYNPVKANLVKEQSDWKWTYCKYEM